MKCPFCGHIDDKVLDSRSIREGQAIKRRRECLQCHRRFTTYEEIEERKLMVIKKDGRREPFDRNKVLRGILTACEKRPIGMETVLGTVEEIEMLFQDRADREVRTSEIGESVMERLHGLDEVAYVRFASVYRQFRDASQFKDLLKGLDEENKA
ncbi:MAG: transcriptional repressor NrdR [Armatimonadetes bacterium]|nr:transcriptional repressor NrdR [Armatimonadota bacterium]